MLTSGIWAQIVLSLFFDGVIKLSRRLESRATTVISPLTRSSIMAILGSSETLMREIMQESGTQDMIMDSAFLRNATDYTFEREVVLFLQSMAEGTLEDVMEEAAMQEAMQETFDAGKLHEDIMEESLKHEGSLLPASMSEDLREELHQLMQDPAFVEREEILTQSVDQEVPEITAGLYKEAWKAFDDSWQAAISGLDKYIVEEVPDLIRVKDIPKKDIPKKEESPLPSPPPQVVPSPKRQRIESDKQDSRRVHNAAERKRREALKLEYENLRKQCPKISENALASTGYILNTACERIKHLQQVERGLLEAKKKLKERNELLQKLGGVS